MSDLTMCRSCRAAVPNGRFCAICGVLLAPEGQDAGPAATQPEDVVHRSVMAGQPSPSGGSVPPGSDDAGRGPDAAAVVGAPGPAGPPGVMPQGLGGSPAGAPGLPGAAAGPTNPRRAAYQSKAAYIVYGVIGASLLMPLGIALLLKAGHGSIPAQAFNSNSLETAQTSCDSGQSGTTVTDGGKTLILDGEGEEDYGGVDSSVLACVLESLRAPDAVIVHMEQTRALDGRQEDTWSGFTASWTYHPDDGIDLIIRRT